MPFTPFHMGAGILIKSIMRGCFSLMVFGWTQIVMDIQPLLVMITGHGHLHGFTHTYIGAILIAAVSAISGKYLSEFGLRLLGIFRSKDNIAWWIAIFSSLLGSFSHVLLDSIMHSDIRPFYPISNSNSLLGIISIEMLHQLLLGMALAGAVLYYLIQYLKNRQQRNFRYSNKTDKQENPEE